MGKNGVTLNQEKFKFCKRKVEFVGFHLDWDSYHPTADRLAAIRDFPMPTQPTITDIHSWHDLVSQLATFMAMAPVMEPFRELLKKPSSKVYWDKQLQWKFDQAKSTVCQLTKDDLVYYDKSRPTTAIMDWSREDIGFVVMQQLFLCVSRHAILL